MVLTSSALARGGATLVIAAALAVTLTATPSGTQTPRTLRQVVPAAEIEQVLTAYASHGDHHALEKWMSVVSLSSQETLRSFESVVRQRTIPKPIRAAFVLEVIAANANPIVLRNEVLLRIGRLVMDDDARPIGVDAAADRFEVLWHHVALALAQRQEQFSLQLSHLDAIGPRFDAARRRNKEPPNRLALARAIAAAGQCCYESLPGPPTKIRVRNLPARAPDAPGVDAVVSLFKKAAADPSLHAESVLRIGVLLHGEGRHRSALEWLQQVPSFDDPPLVFLQHLTHGHVLDALNRPAEAASAYQRAFDLYPNHQAAAIGLAAALLRSGRVVEAAKVAEEAKERPPISIAGDPLLAFRRGDARFLPQWLADMRRLSQ
jgi:tetratricopeptide (TPR) repeat protein